MLLRLCQLADVRFIAKLQVHGNTIYNFEVKHPKRVHVFTLLLQNEEVAKC